MNNNIEKKRLQWKCRRGMLELDWLLQRFLEREFDLLSSDQKRKFDELLDQSDPDLYSWLIDQIKPPREMVDMIERIKFMRD